MPERIGILGGTFDPPHYAHLILAQHAYEELRLDHVLFVPAGQPVHKGERTAIVHRVNMLLLALGDDTPHFVLSRVEIDRPGPHYTVDTIQIIRHQNPDAELFFLMGGDVYRDLPNWERPRQMFQSAKLAVAVTRRPGYGDLDVSLDMHHEAVPELESHALMLSSPLVEFSSTDIVDRLRAGRSVRYMLPDVVLEYIREHKLYEVN
ncbi:MAG: nicotinate (nicotinamide) nucleotide adenylyltransferase [Anaerolineaceae bacterium]|nr:MAG: nicotinate (nicotinamide) nucleotide adenylyltransferase [Anaerolineaceae bacterium]